MFHREDDGPAGVLEEMFYLDQAVLVKAAKNLNTSEFVSEISVTVIHCSRTTKETKQLFNIRAVHNNECMNCHNVDDHELNKIMECMTKQLTNKKQKKVLLGLYSEIICNARAVQKKKLWLMKMYHY